MKVIVVKGTTGNLKDIANWKEKTDSNTTGKAFDSGRGDGGPKTIKTKKTTYHIDSTIREMGIRDLSYSKGIKDYGPQGSTFTEVLPCLVIHKHITVQTG